MQGGDYAICLPSYRSSSPMAPIWLLKPNQPQKCAQIHTEEILLKKVLVLKRIKARGGAVFLYINPIYNLYTEIPIRISGDTRLLAVF